MVDRRKDTANLSFDATSFAKHPNYVNIVIDEDALNALPEDGNVGDSLPSVIDSGDEVDSAAELGQQIASEQSRGPEQGGASGMPRQDNEISEEYMPLPGRGSDNSEAADMEALQRRFGNVPASNWPTRGRHLNDYSTPSLQAMVFPTLFPFGCGDVTKKDRSVSVTMTEANAHLLNYALRSADGTLTFPFVKHNRWMHWAQNTCERHRAASQRNFYMKKNEQDANLSEEDLRKLVRDGGPELQKMIQRMHSYNSNIVGSSCLFLPTPNRA